MMIIGHRGAAGLALENTVEGIKAAVAAGVDAIEFDIRITQDGTIVLCHDRNLGNVSNSSLVVNQNTYAKLKKIKLHNGQSITTLAEAIRAAGPLPVAIEGKESGWAQPLATFLAKQHPRVDYKVLSLNHRELYTFSQLVPKMPVFAVERKQPLSIIQTARRLHFTGIDLNFWILNPLTYALARYYNLEIIIYTVNSRWLAIFLRLLYSRISITTNIPNKLQFLRTEKRQNT